MAIDGNVSIFRLTSGGQTETLVSDKVEFDNDNAVPDSSAHVISAKHSMGIIDTKNPNPGSQDAPSGPDSGNRNPTVELRGYFDEKSGDTLAITSLVNWLRSAKVIKTLYPKGRFGYRNNVRDEFDVVPTTLGGYKITAFETDERYEYLGIVPFFIQLTFYGDHTLLGV